MHNNFNVYLRHARWNGYKHITAPHDLELPHILGPCEIIELLENVELDKKNSSFTFVITK